MECGGGLKAADEALAATVCEDTAGLVTQGFSMTKYGDGYQHPGLLRPGCLRRRPSDRCGPGLGDGWAADRCRCRRRQQMLYTPHEGRRRLSTRQARPLYVLEGIRHPCRSFARAVDGYRDDKRLVSGHVANTFDRQPPFPTEVALVSHFSLGRDNGDKEPTVVNLFPDAAVPGIPASQLTLVKPDFDARSSECIADAFRRVSILRCVAQEHRSRRCTRRLRRLLPHPRPLGLLGAPRGCPEEPG